MENDRQATLEKIAKLLRLAQSTNEHEAALAASKAQELMDRYQISQAMLDADANEPANAAEEIQHFSDADDALDEMGRKRAVWKGSLANMLARHNGCSVYYNGPRLVLVGRPTDAAAVRYLYAYCVREIERLTAAKGPGHGRTWYNNYRLGINDAIATKLREQRRTLTQELQSEARAGGGAAGHAALVRVNDALATVDERRRDVESWVKQNLKLGRASSSGAKRDWNARAAGREDGASINLNSGKSLSAGSARQLKG